MNPSWDSNNSDFVLGALAGHVSELWAVARSDKALIYVDAGTLYFPVLFEDVEVGGVFIGSGHFIVDAIVETRKGAIGQSHEAPWNGSLLLLTRAGNWSPPTVEPVREKQLERYYVRSVAEAQWRAQQVLDRFADTKTRWSTRYFMLRRPSWRATILDKHQGKTHLVTTRDKLVMAREDTKIIVSGNKLVKMDGRRKLVVAGWRGTILRIG